jgi:hypothetical protein
MLTGKQLFGNVKTEEQLFKEINKFENNKFEIQIEK